MEIIRNAVERLTRDWVFRRSLPKEFGEAPIYVSPSAGLKFLFRPMQQTDPNLFRNVAEIVHKGNTVWDIGANVGLFSFSAAAIAGNSGKIIAFEPDAWLVQLLRRSSAIQPATSAPVRVVPAAIACEVGLREFNIAARARAANALVGYGSTQMGGVSEQYTCISLPLDWLAEKLPKPDVIKCDVEGAEVEVFSNQLKILDEVRPTIVCEVGSEAVHEMTYILKSRHYSLFDGERALSDSARTENCTWNTIAIPEEKLDF